MIASVSRLGLGYREQPWGRKVEEACREWLGTRYKLNKCCKGRYVDCIHFVAAVLDTLFGTDHSRNLKSLPPDACIHDRAGVGKALKALLRTYPHRRVRDGVVEAGDLVVWGHSSEKSGPSHVLIASLRGVLWHAARPSVCAIGYGIPDTDRLLAVYRSTEKHLW